VRRGRRAPGSLLQSRSLWRRGPPPRPSVSAQSSRHRRLCSSMSNPSRTSWRILLERRQPRRGEVLAPVHLDKRASGLVEQLHRQVQIRARSVQHRDVALQAGVDSGKHRQGGLHRLDDGRGRAALSPHARGPRGPARRASRTSGFVARSHPRPPPGRSPPRRRPGARLSARAGELALDHVPISLTTAPSPVTFT